MLSLINFEFKKFFHTRKNIVIIGLFIMLLSGFVVLNCSLEDQIKNSEIIIMQNEIDSINNALLKINSEIKRLPDNKDLINIQLTYNQDLKNLKNMKIAYEQQDWQNYLKFKIEKDKTLLENIESGKVLTGKNTNEIQRDIDMNSILLEKKIQPIYENVSMQGFNFIKIIFNSPISVILMVFIIILTADIISSEFEYNTYKLLFTQPISKRKILFSKIVFLVIITNMIILSILSLFCIILGLSRGFGSINYPTPLYLTEKIAYVGIGKYIIFELIMLIVFITFLCVFSTFISTICNNVSSSISIAIIISISLYMITNKGFISKIAHVIPFTYVDISNILLGNLAMISENININFLNSMIFLIASTIIIFIINIAIFNKKIYKN